MYLSFFQLLPFLFPVIGYLMFLCSTNLILSIFPNSNYCCISSLLVCPFLHAMSFQLLFSFLIRLALFDFPLQHLVFSFLHLPISFLFFFFQSFILWLFSKFRSYPFSASSFNVTSFITLKAFSRFFVIIIISFFPVLSGMYFYDHEQSYICSPYLFTFPVHISF